MTANDRIKLECKNHSKQLHNDAREIKRIHNLVNERVAKINSFQYERSDDEISDWGILYEEVNRVCNLLRQRKDLTELLMKKLTLIQ